MLIWAREVLKSGLSRQSQERIYFCCFLFKKADQQAKQSPAHELRVTLGLPQGGAERLFATCFLSSLSEAQTWKHVGPLPSKEQTRMTQKLMNGEKHKNPSKEKGGALS